MKPRIVAKVQSLEGWYAVVLDKNRTDPTPPGKSWVVPVEVKHWGLPVPDPGASLSGLFFPFGGTPSQPIPLDQNGEVIERPIGFFGPGETFEDWVRASEERLAKAEGHRPEPGVDSTG